MGARGVAQCIYGTMGSVQSAAALRGRSGPPAEIDSVGTSRWPCGRDGEHDGAGAPLHASARRRRVGVDFERRTRRSGEGVRCGEYDSGRLSVDASGKLAPLREQWLLNALALENLDISTVFTGSHLVICAPQSVASLAVNGAEQRVNARPRRVLVSESSLWDVDASATLRSRASIDNMNALPPSLSSFYFQIVWIYTKTLVGPRAYVIALPALDHTQLLLRFPSPFDHLRGAVCRFAPSMDTVTSAVIFLLSTSHGQAPKHSLRASSRTLFASGPLRAQYPAAGAPSRLASFTEMQSTPVSNSPQTLRVSPRRSQRDYALGLLRA
ncbi:hypothetical protein HYPSUDRAFT_207986 [Hypholoma sublateritium FD-334 SS-4]|uniref:Uncharacterized protein n=1 Tax=Hypholoma sublateritium (strain FD-334 SS-4) TaxID=945553 RepID=A0A0D2N8B5_HYPSF|nr:hypothetical protein HYPSUDRAFT_207986 [Hypholoma sublateritium FD-334 SS-4]